MTEDPVSRMSRLFRTAMIMSGDLLDGLYGSRDLIQENRQLEKVLDDLSSFETFDAQQMMRLENALSRYASKIMSLYARYPDSTRLDSVYHRACSIRDMCTTCLDGLVDPGSGSSRVREH